MRKLVFDIASISIGESGSGETEIHGRCCGDEIRPGDRVSYMVLYGTGSDAVQLKEPLKLTVTRVAPTFGREIGCIPSAYSGTLYVRASEAIGVRFGWTMEGLNA
ncbi:MAG: hypothetical protein HOQ32_07890 [Lysobacter sp.]|nr:hypothetical protein [Lysobacter sp.]